MSIEQQDPELAREQTEVRATVDEARTVDPEAARYLTDAARELAEEYPVTHLQRTPAGRLVPILPLTEPIGDGVRPFRRNQAAEPAPRWVGVFLVVCAVLFVPYIVELGLSLPTHLSTSHYRAAWVGLDVMELIAIASTAWFALRRSTWVAVSASMACALVVADAWFDVVGAHSGGAQLLAILEAVVVELPFAAFCLWIARHAEAVSDRATRFLLRRSSRQAALLRDITDELSR